VGLTFSNLYEHLIEDESDESVAILDMGHEHSELTIFEMGVPRIVRDISCGGRDTSAAIANALQVSYTDAERAKKSDGLVLFGDETNLDDRQRLMNATCQTALTPLLTEVNRSIAAYEVESGNSIQRIYCTGGASRLRGLHDYLGHSTQVPTQDLDPLRVHFSRISASPDSQGPLISKALALSVQAFAQKHRNQVNLRKGDYGYTGDFSFLRGRIITVTLAVLLMIAMGAMVAVTKKRILEAEHNRLKGEVAVLSQEILGTSNEDVDALLAMVSADRESDSGGIPEYSALRLLAEISDAVDPDIQVDVDRVELDVERKSMTIRGKTGTTSDVDNIVRTLRQNRCFRQTDVPRNEKSSMDGELKRRFRITGKLTCS
jgi:general secretion pathway protein L